MAVRSHPTCRVPHALNSRVARIRNKALALPYICITTNYAAIGASASLYRLASYLDLTRGSLHGRGGDVTISKQRVTIR